MSEWTPVTPRVSEQRIGSDPLPHLCERNGFGVCARYPSLPMARSVAMLHGESGRDVRRIIIIKLFSGSGGQT